MPSPKEIFHDPLPHMTFLQSPNFEGQLFDWKEVKVNGSNQISDLKEKN